MDQMSLFHSDNVSEKHTDEKKVTVVKEHTRETQPKKNREDYIKRMIESGRFPVETVI